MSTGPTDARPLQVRVADDVRDKIERGELEPGQQLPTYDELASEFLCSLSVIRKAVDLLKQQGLVVTVQGKGSFVRERPRARRHAVSRYARSRWSTGRAILEAEAEEQGRTATQLLRELGEAVVPDIVAERLNVEPGTRAWVRRRTTLIDDRPNQLADSYYELDVVDRTPQLKEENTGPGGGFARLEDAGYRLVRIREELATRMPSGPEAAALRLPTGTPVIELIRTTYDAVGHPVEVMMAIIAGDMATFEYEFPIPD